MADAPYLVALALLERGGQRRLPLGGRSWPAGPNGNGTSTASAAAPAAAAADDAPAEEGRLLALELLLRVWQSSDEGGLRRAAGDDSLLLLELPLELMSERLPRLKAAWLAGGETSELLAGLRGLSRRGWRLSIAQREPLRFSPWP